MRPVRRARPTPAFVVILILFGLVGLAAIPNPIVPASAASSGASGSSLTWNACGSGFQCASLSVPVDPSVPEPRLDLAVVRARARDADARIGTLVVNPGGPGVSAVQYLRSAASTLAASVLDRF